MRLSPHFLFTLVAVLVLMLGNTVSADDYEIGVLAKRGPANAMKKWAPTADYLSRKMQGDTFKVVPLDFEAVFPAIEKGEVDFLLVNSSMFVTAQVKYGAAAIATMINSRQGESLQSFGGVIFTYRDRDDLNTLADLKGKKIMGVQESSFGGWQMAYKEFLDQGIDPASAFASLQFGNSHDNVVYAVQNGAVDAGTVRTDTLERMAAAGDIALSEFKILAAKKYAGFPFVVSTALYPEWPMAKHANTSNAVAQRVAEALLAMQADDPAAKAAQIIGWTDPMDYQIVEGLQKLLQMGAYE